MTEEHMMESVCTMMGPSQPLFPGLITQQEIIANMSLNVQEICIVSLPRIDLGELIRDVVGQPLLHRQILRPPLPPADMYVILRMSMVQNVVRRPPVVAHLAVMVMIGMVQNVVRMPPICVVALISAKRSRGGVGFVPPPLLRTPPPPPFHLAVMVIMR